MAVGYDALRSLRLPIEVHHLFDGLVQELSVGSFVDIYFAPVGAASFSVAGNMVGMQLRFQDMGDLQAAAWAASGRASSRLRIDHRRPWLSPTR
jgi:hypothetical protein